jgi:hypothetical protein
MKIKRADQSLPEVYGTTLSMLHSTLSILNAAHFNKTSVWGTSETY